jgi:hypothetical protein
MATLAKWASLAILSLGLGACASGSSEDADGFDDAGGVLLLLSSSSKAASRAAAEPVGTKAPLPAEGDADAGGAPPGSVQTDAGAPAPTEPGTGTPGTPAAPADAGSPSSTDPYAQDRVTCVATINMLRATKGLAALTTWASADSCVDQQVTHDESVGIPHDAFNNGSPSCGGAGGQNECEGGDIVGCLQQMWAEGSQPGCSGCDACDTYTIYEGGCANCTFNGDTVCGHYVNMTSPDFSATACGFAADGWAAIDFE